MVVQDDSIIYYEEDGDDSLQVEDTLAEHGNFVVTIREDEFGYGREEDRVYATILLSRERALKLIASLSTALVKTG